MKQTKAQLQIQFNWIFVIIIGSVLLLFFFGLINSQAKDSTTKINIHQSKYFETIITSTGQKSGTLKLYDINNIQIAFTCDTDDETDSYSVKNLPARDTKYDIIFTQETFDGDDIITLTRAWQIPFKSATFLYITNTDQGYVFYNYSSFPENNMVESSPTFKQLYNTFPKNISSHVITPKYSWDDSNNENFNSYTYIFLKGEEPFGVEFAENKKNSIIIVGEPYLQPDYSDYFTYGEVYFLTSAEYIELSSELGDIPTNLPPEQKILARAQAYEPYEAHNSSYMGKSSLYGAIFSEDKDFYECNMNKAFRRLELVTRLYYFRTELLLENEEHEFDLDMSCQQALGVHEQKDTSDPYYPFETLNYLQRRILPGGFQPEKVPVVFEYLHSLNKNNKHILVRSNCPEIY